MDFFVLCMGQIKITSSSVFVFLA